MTDFIKSNDIAFGLLIDECRVPNGDSGCRATMELRHFYITIIY